VVQTPAALRERANADHDATLTCVILLTIFLALLVAMYVYCRYRRRPTAPGTITASETTTVKGAGVLAGAVLPEADRAARSSGAVETFDVDVELEASSAE